MNGLSNNIYPYSLNNLQTISTSDGGALPVSANAPIIKETTATNQNIFLYESSTDFIDFNAYNKSLRVKDLIANTGSFSAIYSTGARFFSLNATGVNADTLTATTSIVSNGSLNAPNAFIDCDGINSIGSNPIRTTFGFTGPFITAGSGTFQNVNTNTLTANTINISSLNIPNLQFTRATGGFINASGSIVSGQNLRTTNGIINTHDFTDISSNGNTSIYNVGDAEQISFQFDGNERIKLSSSGKLDVSFLQSSGAFTGASIATTSTIKSGGVLSTTSGRIANNNTSWTTVNSNDLYINSNNDTIFLRPKGEVADGQVSLTNTGNLTCSTGTFSAFNGTFSGGLNATNANISAFALTASSFVRAPYFTGAKVDTNSLTFTTATGTSLSTTNLSTTNSTFTTSTGGNLFSNVFIKNGQVLQFNQADNTQIIRAEPGAISNVVSFYNNANILQLLMTTSSSGATLDFINTMGSRQITNLFTMLNGDGTLAVPSYSFINNTNMGFFRGGLNNMALSIANRRNIDFTQNTITMGSGASNNVNLDLNGDLKVGATNVGSSTINMGYSGAQFGVNNTRLGYIINNGSSLELNNQQASTGSNDVGRIILTAGNSVNTLIKRPNGLLTNTANALLDYSSSFINNTTNGYGMLLNKPNSSDASGNNLYNLAIQGTDFNPSHTFHSVVSGKVSNITLGRTNFPTTDDAITLRPFSNNSQDIHVCYANHKDQSNGFVFMGQKSTGTNKRASDAFIENYSNQVGGKASGIFFQTNTEIYTSNIPAQYINFKGEVFFNPADTRIAPFSSSYTGSVLSATEQFKSLPQVGAVYSMSRGAGQFIPWIKASCTNTTYTVASGRQKIQLSDAGSVNASPWQTPAGARQFSFKTDFQGLYEVRWNLNIFATLITQYTLEVFVNGASQSITIGDISRASTFQFCNGTILVQCALSADIDVRITPDTQTITIGNNSTIQGRYLG